MVEIRIEELRDGDLYNAEDLVRRFIASHKSEESRFWEDSILVAAENLFFEVESVERFNDGFIIRGYPFNMPATLEDTVFVLEDDEDANWY